MKASELRIGNLLYFFKDTPAMVVSISSDSLYLTQGGGFINPKTEECEPIPLTEDWLLKFGFELINNEYWQSRNSEFKLYWTVNKNKMIPEFNEKRLIAGYDFKYVHQLQNLYFALTGEELCIGKT
jgi:hypothetical protein